MLRTDLADYRRATEDQLVAALRKRDPLALAEAYHRTVPGAHGAARRLLPGSTEVEALLREVYSQLWSSPPDGAALDGWTRSRCFAVAAEHLRERNAPPAAPSLTVLLPELPRPEVRYLDAAERALAELDDTQRKALLLAHDKGVPTDEQDVPQAERALVAALLTLAGPEPGAEQVDATACADLGGLADWVLGLLVPARAAEVAAQAGARPECTALAKALRRGRRRLEGLPPTPDMGQRVLAVVLAGSPAPAPAAPSPPPVSSAPAGAPAPMTSVLDDTSYLRPPPVAAAGANAPSEYTAVSSLDDSDDGDPTGLADRASATAAPASDPDDEGFMGYAGTSGRSLGGRVLVWVLGALFLLAGVAAGLYLGLTLFS